MEKSIFDFDDKLKYNSPFKEQICKIQPNVPKMLIAYFESIAPIVFPTGKKNKSIIIIETINYKDHNYNFELVNYDKRELDITFKIIQKPLSELENKAIVLVEFTSNKTGINSFGFKLNNLSTNHLSLAFGEERKMVSEHTPSSSFLLKLKQFEGLGNKEAIEYDTDGNIKKLFLYNDSSNYATIGYGHLIARKTVESLNQEEKDKWINGITLERAEELLLEDIKNEQQKLITGLRDNKGNYLFEGVKVKLLQREFDALLLAVFNGGYGSTLENIINKGPDTYTELEIFKGFLTRRFSGGQEIQGLIKRRAEEADIFYNDNWMPYPSSKYKTQKDYITYYLNFIQTNLNNTKEGNKKP